MIPIQIKEEKDDKAELTSSIVLSYFYGGPLMEFKGCHVTLY